ncbi:MAG: diheme cytochrome c-553, partial [Salinimicrobium sp.]
SIGCGDCHSPKKFSSLGPEEIPELRLSGYQQGTNLPPIDEAALKNGWMLLSPDLTAAVGPWGVSFAANITSDETGIGNWSFDQFKIAMREGKFKGMKNGRDLLPPMPWPNFAHLTDDDLKAIFEYLKSTKPVQNAVPGPIPPDKLASLKK